MQDLLALSQSASTPEVIDDAKIGAELTMLYVGAQAAELAILRFGAAFCAVEKIVSATCGGNSPKRGPGSFGFSSWLEKHAPEIAETTARRYRDVAIATAERFKIADPVRVFSLPPAELDEKERAKREKVVDFVASKSMRGLQLELGLITRGNPRPAADRTPEERAADEDPDAPIPFPKALPFTMPEDRERFEKLTNPQRIAWLDWVPRARHILADLQRKAPSWPHLDQASRDDLLSTLAEVRTLLAPRS